MSSGEGVRGGSPASFPSLVSVTTGSSPLICREPTEIKRKGQSQFPGKQGKESITNTGEDCYMRLSYLESKTQVVLHCISHNRINISIT